MFDSSRDWTVLLIGGPSGVGKSIVAERVGRALGVPWLQVDDLRLALERSGLPVPDCDQVMAFDAPGGLVDLANLMSPAIEVVVGNHVDTDAPVIIEGDSILPSLFARPSVLARAADGRVRAIFLVEPDEHVLFANMRARGRGMRQWTEAKQRAHARKNWLFGQWLGAEARRCGLPVLEPRPCSTLVERVVLASSAATE